ncbi:hypothetical protein MSG28_002614 [Choristoneura fumiferana]|uniref:Uncharacterized protein n=1 Tax=Choristoneura fumiferana TaxID=7141 RepID=A0ACC0JIN7_CHOFU|nr:hypothetical protein MSG28_002614 [Choristoneura fumiferana]
MIQTKTKTCEKKLKIAELKILKIKCLLAIPSTSKTLFRPPEDCSMCAGVDSVTRVANISAREFEDLYAYNTIPVIEFSFEFFREFYQRGSLGRQTSACSFFAYNSGLRSLADVFAMDEQRANLYVGWSTCFEAETAALRGYYSRPYFLPPAAESDAVRGRKRWQLAPPPECLYACRQISFTVAPHEILVVDTNRWYHRTTVLPGDISITIGAEYD